MCFSYHFRVVHPVAQVCYEEEEIYWSGATFVYNFDSYYY